MKPRRFFRQFIFFLTLPWFFTFTVRFADGATGSSRIQLLSATENAVRFVCRIDSSAVQMNATAAGQTLTIAEYFADGRPGEVQIPRRAIAVALPPDAKPQLAFTVGNWLSFPAAKPLRVPELDAVTGKLQPIETIQPAPEQDIVAIAQIGWVGDQYLVTLRISPVRYDANAGAFLVAQSIEVSLTFAASAAQSYSATLPVSVADTALLHMVINPQQARNWLGKSPAPTQQSPASLTAETGDRAKIVVDTEGWYRISGEMLKTAGIDYLGLDPRRLRLLHDQQEIPILVTGASDAAFDTPDAIIFLGELNHGEKTYLSPYSEENTYMLTYGSTRGLRLAEVDGGLYRSGLTPATPIGIRHFEEDNDFDRLLLVGDAAADHWFWTAVKGLSEEDLAFQIPDDIATDADSIYLTAALMGNTHITATYPDHSVVLRINGRTVAAQKWDGQNELVIADIAIARSTFVDGENVLTIRAPGDTEAGEIDEIYFNWFELRYRSRTRVLQDRAHFSVAKQSGPAEFALQGFTAGEVYVFDRAGRRFANYLVTREKDLTYTIRFQDPLARTGRFYDAFTAEALLEPKTIDKVLPTNLTSTANGADLIVISHPDFLDGIKPLVDLRKKQGLRVQIVSTEDIYNEFASGSFAPEAIRTFLAYAYTHWQQPRPRYVLLVGDAHDGYRKHRARAWGTCYLPTYLAYTAAWGLTSSDNYFVQVSGDDILPDMAIGRLPCNSVDELEAMVDKIVNYDAQPEFARWRAEVNLSVGELDFFENQADYLNNSLIPKSVKVSRLYTNPKSRYFGGTDELVNIFNNGAVIMNFIGHGGGGVFFDSGLFLLDDVVLLRNARRLPAVFAWSCFIGYFDNAGTPSLGEVLLRNPQYGAVAIIGAAGRAWLNGDFQFNSATFETIFDDGFLELGEILRRGKISMLAKYGGISGSDLVHNYNLLGDPSMKLALPKKTVELTVPTAVVQSGQSIHVNGKVAGANNGQVVVEAYVKDDSLVANKTIALTEENFQTSLPVGRDLRGDGVIRAYYANASVDARGAAFFSIDAARFDQVATQPALPQLNRPFTLSVNPTAKPGVTIDSLMLQWGIVSTSLNNTLRMVPVGSGTYRTAKTLVSGAATFYYRFHLYGHTGSGRNEEFSPVATLAVASLADIGFLSGKIVIGGTTAASVSVQIKNYGGSPSGRFVSALYLDSTTAGSAQTLASAQIDGMAAGDTAALSFLWPTPKAGYQKLAIKIDPDNTLGEPNRGNNQYSFYVPIATVQTGTNGLLFGIPDSSVAINIPAQSLVRNSLLQISSWRQFETGQQAMPSGVVPVRLRKSNQSFFLINAINDTLEIKGTATVRLYYDTADTNWQKARQQGSLRVLFWDLATQTTSVLTSTLNEGGGYVQSTLSAPGAVGLVRLFDTVPPVINVKIADQVFANGDYVARNPQFSVVVSDEAGIDLQRRPPAMTLDGKQVATSNYTLAQGGSDDDMVLANFAPNLSAGNHQFSVIAYDRNGNKAEKAVVFSVADDFALLTIANHPNPFQESTVIAYTLRAEASEVSVKIYTVAGRLIRKWQFYNQIGYAEIEWDGRDDNGEEMANGVYYLRLLARQGEKTIERIEKMARLR